MTVEQSDELVFAREDDDADTGDGGVSALAPWKILVVDDDADVHAVTRMALAGVAYRGREVVCLSAYSAGEAVRLMARDRSIAVVLLDMIMETEDAGLRVIHAIRDELNNSTVRIILRTGQPGETPERQLILDYDINDYKTKSDLTSPRLFATIIAALRSYSDIITIETARTSLEKILVASTSLFERRSVEQFIEGALIELKSLIGDAHSIVLCKVLAKGGGNRLDFRAMSADGDLVVERGASINTVLPVEVCDDIKAAYRDQTNIYREQHCVIVFRSRYHVGTVIYMRGHAPLGEANRRLLEVFCSTLAIGFDNAALYEGLTKAQQATVFALADLAEHKDTDTGEHVRRIERLSMLISERLLSQGLFPNDLDTVFINQIGLASILHDVGKVAIPDAILRKPCKLDAEEWDVMKTHARVGGKILTKAATLVEGRSYLSMAAEIASSHHEKFNGTGYPLGLSGDAIPLSARITAVADVFDALTSRRPYKEPWSLDMAIAEIRAQSGMHFDPRVVEALISIVVPLTDAP